jgi:hypothetical protein
VAQVGTTLVVVGVEPLMLPIGADAEVGGKPTAAANAVADTGEAGKWGDDDTPSDTSKEHYQMELPQPFSSCSCGNESRRP